MAEVCTKKHNLFFISVILLFKKHFSGCEGSLASETCSSLFLIYSASGKKTLDKNNLVAVVHSLYKAMQL